MNKPKNETMLEEVANRGKGSMHPYRAPDRAKTGLRMLYQGVSRYREYEVFSKYALSFYFYLILK